jgi:crotonobetainyl-CoA:carnitine CoA-transferase CaiB-like acyl-CoA transferase
MAWSGVRALLWRETEGEGTRTELAMTEIVSAFVAEALLQWQVAGVTWQPEGNTPREGQGARMGCPRGVYRALGDDAWVAVSIDSQPQWSALARTIGTPALRDLIDMDADGRAEHAATITAELAMWIGARSSWAAAHTLLATGVPATACCNAPELLGHPQLLARGFVRIEPHAEVGPRLGLAAPVRMPRSDPPRPAPLYGEHNHEVLAEFTDAPEAVAQELDQAAERARPRNPQG